MEKKKLNENLWEPINSWNRKRLISSCPSDCFCFVVAGIALWLWQHNLLLLILGFPELAWRLFIARVGRVETGRAEAVRAINESVRWSCGHVQQKYNLLFKAYLLCKVDKLSKQFSAFDWHFYEFRFYVRPLKWKWTPLRSFWCHSSRYVVF